MPRKPPDGEKQEIIELELGIDAVLADLARSHGMVVNLELRDGSKVCGVLGGANSDVLILEHWDDSAHSPNGDPFVVSCKSVQRIVIP